MAERFPVKVNAPAPFSTMLLAGADRDQLADAGVGWVVVESGSEATALALPVAYHDDDLTVYRVGGDHAAASGRGVVLARAPGCGSRC